MIHHRLMCRFLTILILTRRILIEAAIGMMNLISSLGLFLFDLLNLLVGCTRVSRSKNDSLLFFIFLLSLEIRHCYDFEIQDFLDRGLIFLLKIHPVSLEKNQELRIGVIWTSLLLKDQEICKDFCTDMISTSYKRIELNYYYF